VRYVTELSEMLGDGIRPYDGSLYPLVIFDSPVSAPFRVRPNGTKC
jgi:hypothetical protein